MKKNVWQKLRIGDWGSVSAGRQRSEKITAGILRPYLRVANVFDGYIDTRDVLRMPFTDAEVARFRLLPGDILINEGQSLELVGRSAIYEGEPEECCYQNTLIRFRAGPECDPRFAHMLFRHLWQSRVFERVAKKTTSIAHLGVKRFANVTVTVPPVESQRLMSGVLGGADDLLAALKESVAAKRKMRRAVAQRLLTGRLRFPEFVTSGDRQKGETGDVPADWLVVQIGEIADDVSEKGAAQDAVVYSCTKHQGLVPSLEYFGKQVFSRNLSGYKRVEAGDFVYATNHIEEGSIGLLPEGASAGLVSPMYTVFRCGAAVQPEFMLLILKTESYRRIFEKRTSASVDRRGSLRWPAFSKIRVALPSLAEQGRITEVLRLADREISLLEALAKQRALQKRGLMQGLLAGELRVAEVAETPA